MMDSGAWLGAPSIRVRDGDFRRSVAFASASRSYPGRVLRR